MNWMFEPSCVHRIPANDETRIADEMWQSKAAQSAKRKE